MGKSVISYDIFAIYYITQKKIYKNNTSKPSKQIL